MAATAQTLDDLFAAIDARLGVADEVLEIAIPGHQGQLIAWMYENAEVLARTAGEDGALRLRVRIASEKKDRVIAKLRAAGIPV